MTRYLIIISLLILTTSCILKQIDYPYAENNATEQNYFGTVLKDDYKWLELNVPMNEKRTEWLNAQYQLSNKEVTRSNDIYKRITELGGISYTLHAGIIGDQVFFLKAHLYRKKAALYSYSRHESRPVFIREFEFPFQLKASSRIEISPDGKKLAVMTEDLQNNIGLYVFDLMTSEDKPVKHIPYINDYPAKWATEGQTLFFIKDGITDTSDSIKSFYLCSFTFQENETKVSRYITNDTDHLFNSIGYTYDKRSNQLYIAERQSNNNQINIYRVTPDDEPSLCLWHTQAVNTNYNYRIAGVDSLNLYLIKFNQLNKGALYGLSKESRTMIPVMEARDVAFSGFSIIKDHLVVGYKNTVEHEIYLINNKSLSKRKIAIRKKGRYNFFNNPNDSVIYFNHETYLEPRSLYYTSIENPDKHIRVCQFEDIPYKADDFVTEYTKLKSANGDSISFSVSYKKGIQKNGKNPTVLLSYLNGSDDLKNSFYFSRILFMEHGFIFVQRNDVENIKSIPVAERAKDLKLMRDYLIANKFTSKEHLCLSGREYGCTAIALALNQYPDFCKTVIMADGVYDLVNFKHKHELMLSSDSREQFNTLLNLSPYHHIRQNASYPSMILLTSDLNGKIYSSQTHKYVAKLQMRTKGCNPILLYRPEKKRITESVEVTDYYDNIYQTLSFLLKDMNMGYFCL
ncbi:MAG: prolyl oligopeptidase family serine peptidase [Bacteroidales bacterium]